jgi:isoamylase
MSRLIFFQEGGSMTSSGYADPAQGRSFPLGATVYPDGVNFSVFSRSATGLELLLFDRVDDPAPARVIQLDALRNFTTHYWHIFVPGILPGQLYAYRAYGPFDPQNGLRFDSQKVLLDPYGNGVAVPPNYSRGAACRPGDNTHSAMKSVVADLSAYNWEGDAPLHRPFGQTVIYEMHVGGFTRHPSSGVAPQKRGTYAGLIEKIPYLKDLGITAVELQPVYQFDEQDAPGGLTNYWGYSPVSYFAPHVSYSSRRDPLGPLDEFRDMVRALHRAGIEVILDVVYNHTTEGNEYGPTLCYRGLDNDTYYILEPNRAYYSNYTGTGNTLDADNAIVRRLITDSLHHWVSEMHVDGFRFDLASILSRDENGVPLGNPPILWDIDTDPILAGTKLIAEAWDAAGLYQVGSFVGDNWKEWNGKFRDDIRGFVKGDPDTVSKLPNRLLASPDLYVHEGLEPEQSINFVTCHDGFTLNDLVSYDGKHNEANQENDQDGSNDNRSWNCGVEGPTDDPEIEQLRDQQVKNFFAITLASLGTPMLLMGDEVRRTQGGNNNAYCQDNVLTWFDWTFLEKYADIHRFAREMVHLRLEFDKDQNDQGLTLAQYLQQARIEWHGVKLYQPDWSVDSHSLAVMIQNRQAMRKVYIILNAYWGPLDFELPPLTGDPQSGWQRLVDTGLPSPDDVSTPPQAPQISGSTYTAQPHSVVILVAGNPG